MLSEMNWGSGNARVNWRNWWYAGINLGKGEGDAGITRRNLWSARINLGGGECLGKFEKFVVRQD